MPGTSKVLRGTRNLRTEGSPSGLNQASAIGSPLYFNAAQCVEGGCSEKFTPHLRHLRASRSRTIVTPAREGGKAGGVSRGVRPLRPLARLAQRPRPLGARGPH